MVVRAVSTEHFEFFAQLNFICPNILFSQFYLSFLGNHGCTDENSFFVRRPPKAQQDLDMVQS